MNHMVGRILVGAASGRVIQYPLDLCVVTQA